MNRAFVISNGSRVAHSCLETMKMFDKVGAKAHFEISIGTYKHVTI